jgi:hypothetical protein
MCEIKGAMLGTPPQAEFVLHGMDERGAIKWTERLTGLSRRQLRVLAKERLERFPMVEVVQGTRRVLFLER